LKSKIPKMWNWKSCLPPHGGSGLKLPSGVVCRPLGSRHSLNSSFLPPFFTQESGGKTISRPFYPPHFKPPFPTFPASATAGSAVQHPAHRTHIHSERPSLLFPAQETGIFYGRHHTGISPRLWNVTVRHSSVPARYQPPDSHR